MTANIGDDAVMKDLDQRNLGETGVYSYYDSRLQPIRMRGGKGSQWHGLEVFSHSEEQRETNIERSTTLMASIPVEAKECCCCLCSIQVFSHW